ncbi:MAG TPA: ATP-binding protein [Armatimonadota bacterium]|jgi:anti-sigma regulatory factor (Ser/Thr protein kinase)
MYSTRTIATEGEADIEPNTAPESRLVPGPAVREGVRLRLAEALSRDDAAIRRAWASSLLATGAPLYHTLESGDLDAAVHALFDGYVDYLRTGSVSAMGSVLAAVARRRFAQGFALVDMEASVGAVRQAVLIKAFEEFSSEHDMLIEAVGAVILGEEIGAVRIAEAYQEMTSAELHAAQEDALRAEHDKVVFCREMARVATHGKLILCDDTDVPERTDVQLVNIATAREIREARRDAAQLADDLGWSEHQNYALQLCIGECGSNALRHAGAATFQVWTHTDAITFRLADTGPGIELCRIPSSLQAGFSTESSLGMGFTLMLELADRICLATDHRGTILQISLAREPGGHH